MEAKAHVSEPAGGLSTAELFRAHAAFVASFVLRLGAPRESVDDVVQEVFLVVHRRGGYQPGAARPTTWLAAIAVRVVSTLRRGERRRRAVPDEDALLEVASGERDPLQAAEQREALTRVDQALAALDVDRRAAFILYEIEGESCETIAAGFDVPVGTVHSRLFAARRAFVEAYARLEIRDAHHGPSAPSRGPAAPGDRDGGGGK